MVALRFRCFLRTREHLQETGDHAAPHGASPTPHSEASEGVRPPPQVELPRGAKVGERLTLAEQGRA